MPIESASTINQLVPTNPEDSDDTSQGAQQIRLVKSTIQASFPQIIGTLTASNNAIDNAVGWFHSNTTANGVTVAATASLPNAGLSLAPPLVANAITGSTLTLNNTGFGVQIMSGGNQIANITTSGVNFGSLSVMAAGFFQSGVSAVPSGVIVAWYGSVVSIPAGWLLCNGQNGTPDLRGMMIIGAGGSYSPGQTGGAASAYVQTDQQGYHDHSGVTGQFGAVTLTGGTDQQGAHSHGGGTGLTALSVDELPPHTHGYNGIGAGAAIPGGSGYGVIGEQTDGGAGLEGNPHNHSISTDGLHSHNLQISQYPAHSHQIYYDGEHYHNVTVPTLPPFYALCFIMKQ